MEKSPKDLINCFLFLLNYNMLWYPQEETINVTDVLRR